MKTELDSHIHELLSFLKLIDNGTFQGKDSKQVTRLKEYLNEILTQLINYKNQNTIEE